MMDENRHQSNLKKLISIFFTGLAISVLGSLPVGTLNITAFQLSATKSMTDGLSFSFAAIIVELIVVSLTLYGAQKINFNGKFFRNLTPLAIGLLIYLAVESVISSGSNHISGVGSGLFMLTNSSFLLGILLSSVNPLQIPFWMSWNSILFSRKKLNTAPATYVFYLAGIGVGSLLGLLIFVLSGNYFQNNFHAHSSILSYVMACIYLVLAIYLFTRLYKSRIKLQTH